MTKNPDLATAFHQLHRGPELLLLANAWDAGSARLMESLGARAIATTSAGVAWAHGYPDGDALPGPLVIATAAAIASAVRVPVTIDIEGGYSDDPQAVGSLIGALIEAGAAGVNLEDGGAAPEFLCAKIAEGRRVAEAVWGRAASLATAFLRDGRGEVPAEGAMSYREINTLVARR